MPTHRDQAVFNLIGLLIFPIFKHGAIEPKPFDIQLKPKSRSNLYGHIEHWQFIDNGHCGNVHIFRYNPKMMYF